MLNSDAHDVTTCWTVFMNMCVHLGTVGMYRCILTHSPLTFTDGK